MDRAARALLTVTTSGPVILLLLNAMLIVAGMLLDAISIYSVFVPIFLPLMNRRRQPLRGLAHRRRLDGGGLPLGPAVLRRAARGPGLVVHVPALTLWLPDALGIR